MLIDTLVTDCRDHIRRMRDLNLRAGKEIFPVPNAAQLEQHFVAGLGSARSVSEIRDWQALALPVIDQNLIDSVLAGCPDSIVLLGATLTVEYIDRYGGVAPHPYVKLPSQLMRSHRWMELPDEGVYLPSGREVAICFSPDGYSDFLAEINIPTLKAKALDSLNRGEWHRFNKPNLPEPIGGMPPIEKRQYGRCVVTKEPLYAYATYRRGLSSWYTAWTRDLSEAEQLHEDACRRFDELQASQRRANLQKQAHALYQTHYRSLSSDLQNQLREVVFGYVLHPAEKIESVITAVEAYLKPQTVVADPDKIDLSRMFGGSVRVNR